ncbi:uncharacterized protein LOC126553456 [Aphis gossypii]|uniref:uncharacterized protein LOC126552227 n=1 Tax=Aphis gossypii TaxID=80765 RepID=UPI002158A501|nr:uncharacterized protein LOC126552227 [Aphis gossypii]XP_050062882.1 uncharacterized protein LOC126552228 [Aphis gossypii]XP_050064575.1 uncharacterized protein LOC126553456 [Aphis gossypii]
MCFQYLFRRPYSITDLKSPNTNQDHNIFNISILKRDLGTKRKFLKMTVMSLNQDKISFMKEKRKNSSKSKSIDLMYSSIRACGIRDTFFYIVLDDNKSFHCGFLWVKSTNIHEIYGKVGSKIGDCSCKRKLIPSENNDIDRYKVLPPPRPSKKQEDRYDIHLCKRKQKSTTYDSGYMVPPPPRPFHPQNEETECPCYIS